MRRRRKKHRQYLLKSSRHEHFCLLAFAALRDVPRTQISMRDNIKYSGCLFNVGHRKSIMFLSFCVPKSWDIPSQYKVSRLQNVPSLPTECSGSQAREVPEAKGGSVCARLDAALCRTKENSVVNLLLVSEHFFLTIDIYRRNSWWLCFPSLRG